MTEDLVRRREAVIALTWFGGIFFIALIGMNVVQALNEGYGLVHGHVLQGEVGDQQGQGAVVDALIVAGTMAACGLILAAWHWLASRLPILGGPEMSPEAVDEEDFYLVKIPRITRALTIVGVICAVAVSLAGAILFPVILVKYGW